MASALDLTEWCRVKCADYPNVEIRNLSTSFRDGLAFCAIIHKHRPDLINFNSLSKDNVYQNNKLAFEVAEKKLGIPALLDPTDMVSCKVPDCLSITTYLSQYYYYFNSKSYAGPGLRSSYITLLKHFTKSKTPHGLKPLKSSAHLETSKDNLCNARPQTVCKLCSKPVHLIQRRLIEGEVYHRSCFRCKVCCSTLLPDSYMQGRDTGSLICTHHNTYSKTGASDNLHTCELQAGYHSLSGLVISSVPRYSKKTDLQDKLVCETAKTEGKERQERENGDSSDGLKSMVKTPELLRIATSSTEDKTEEGNEQARPALAVAESKSQRKTTKTQQPSQPYSPCVRATGGSGRPVPAPRRMLDSSAVPVPAPRVKTPQTTSSSSAAGNSSNQCRSSSISPDITSPVCGSPKVKASHPWLGIIHPGPWTQLPPAPPPLHNPRSKSVSNLQEPWNRPRVPAPNPFEEEVEEKTSKHESTGQTSSSVKACHGGNVTNKSMDTVAAVCSGDVFKSNHNDKPIPPKRLQAVSVDTVEMLGSPFLDSYGETVDSLPDVSEAAAAEEAPSHFLPRSVSVPAIASAQFQRTSVADGLTEVRVTSSESKQTCKEKPSDQKPAMSKSKTFQSLPSRRAPGHGFPLIKRKVQTDQSVSPGDLQVEVRELNKQLEALERRGVELENNLRDCKNDKEEEQMLMDWFSLVHERHALVRRDTELVYLTKQQMLEGRQADVEYGLRCLLNKPESDWSQQDQIREQQLTNELVAIIEQRDQIISSLDQDRQREKEEDVLWETMMKNKDLQREGLKEIKKSKGKLKPTKVLKMLSHKAESTKDAVDKNS